MIQEREITLSSAIRVIWERGKRILQLTLLAMVIGGIATLFIPNRYQSSTMMIVKVSSIGVHNVDKEEQPYDIFWNFFPTVSQLNQIIDDYDLDEEPFDFEHHKDLRNRIYIDDVRETPLFTITVTLESATTAAQVSNRLAADAERMAQEMLDKEIIDSHEQLTNQFDIIDQEMQEEKQEYLNMIKDNKLPLYQHRLESKNAILATLRSEKNTLDHSIRELQKREDGFEEVFSSTDYTKYNVTQRSVIDDPLLTEITRKNMFDNNNRDFVDNIGELNLFNQEINGSYLQLDMEYRKLTVDLPAMIEKRKSMMDRIQLLEEEVSEMQERIFDMQMDEATAKMEYDRAMEVLGGVYKQVGWIGTTVATERLDVYQLDEAVPDHKKVYPRRSVMVGIIGMIAFLIAFIFYLLMDLYGLVVERKPRAGESTDTNSS